MANVQLYEKTGKCWLWPDRNIGKRESRQLREEHNALVNRNAELIEAAEAVLNITHNLRLDGPTNEALSALYQAVNSAKV